MEYRVYHPQEVWLFYPDGGGERFAKLGSNEAAELVARLLNENLAKLAHEAHMAELLAKADGA